MAKRTTRSRTTEPIPKEEAWANLEDELKLNGVIPDDIKQAYDTLKEEGNTVGDKMTCAQIEAATKLLERVKVEQNQATARRIQEAINSLITNGRY